MLCLLQLLLLLLLLLILLLPLLLLLPCVIVSQDKRKGGGAEGRRGEGSPNSVPRNIPRARLSHAHNNQLRPERDSRLCRDVL